MLDHYADYESTMLLTIYRTAVGLRVKDGVVLAVEKLIQSKLLVPGANRRIQSADLHIGIVSKRHYHAAARKGVSNIWTIAGICRSDSRRSTSC